MKARLGKAEGLTATAEAAAHGTSGGRSVGEPHKLARILFAMMTRRTPDDENQAFKQTPATLSRRILNLQKQAAKLGFQLSPAL